MSQKVSTRPRRRLLYVGAAVAVAIPTGVAFLVASPSPSGATVPELVDSEFQLELSCPVGEPFVEIQPDYAAGSLGAATPLQAIARFTATSYPRLDPADLAASILPSGTQQFVLDRPAGTTLYMNIQEGNGWFVTGFRACNSEALEIIE